MFADWQATLSKSLRVAFAIAAPLLATTAHAAILDASWTAPTTNVDGTPLTDLASYRVYYGTSPTPCPGTSFVQVPSATPSPAPNTTVAHRLTGLAAGTTYFVSVTAVDTSGNESACLSPAQSAVARLEFSVSPSGTIAFGNVAIGSTADQAVTVQNTAGGTVSGTITTSAPFTIVSGASFTLTGTGATHTATVRFAPVVAAAVTANLTVSAGGSSVSRVLSGTGLADTTAPTVAITTPTSAGTFTTSSATINIGGTASDNIAVTQVTWTNSRGGSGTATGTTSWSANNIALQPGTNVLTVTARDLANNTATATLTVTVSDSTAPTVAITTPTSAATFTTSSATINLGGTASDNVGVTQVTWTNSRGGSGTATGTTSWSASGIALQTGSNVLTVTARDAANNTATATLTVTVSDSTAPTVTITSPTTAATFSTSSASLSLGGTASDDVGVTQVTWANSRGGGGTATGTTNWSVNNVALQPGANVLTVTARDAANNTATATLTVTFTDNAAPTVTITAPTTAATFTTSNASINLGGTASDNVGVTQVSWSNNRGGGGTATGTGNWTVTGAALQPGANVLTVTARDAANNTASATLTVTFTDTTAPTVTLTAPTAGATVGGTLNVTATATDNVGVVGVQFRLDGANLGAEVTAPPFAVSWNTTASVNGSHSLTAVARDAAGNTATAAAVVVTVSNVAPPVISGVTVSGITSTSATISWTTDTLSDTQVEFGPTTAYGSTAGTATLVTSHTQTLNGLAPNTTYQFRVKSRDAAGNVSTSGNFSFTTLPDASTGLLAHWMFNDGSGTSASDSSGNGHTGTLSSGASWAPGIMQQALALDGQAGFVSVPTAGALNAYPISISGWVRTSSTTGTRGILNKLVPGVANGYRLFMSDGNLCAEYFRSAAAFVSDGTACPLAVAGYADGQWHHVVFVVDALGGRIYVDGVQRASRGWTGTSGAPNSGQPITIGDDGGASGFFAGTIDDLRIYGRALSAGEVSGLYGSAGGGGGGTGAPTVSGVAVTAVNQTSATVVWSTNVPSDSQVEFGTSPAYGATTPLDTAFVTSHSRMLTGLQPGTTYHFRVRSRDAAGNLAVSADSTFRTPDMVRVVQQNRKKNTNWFDDFLDLFLK